MPAAARALRGAADSGPPAEGSAVAAAVLPGLSAAGLGPSASVHALVVDATTGATLVDQGGSDSSAPASTVKVATAAAALLELGPETRLVTTVAGPAPVQGTVVGNLVLVGAGDQTLTTGPATGLRGRVTMAALAATLQAAGVRRVTGRVLGDGSLFTGPATAPGWRPTYVSDGSVAPVSALEVDGGRNAPSPEAAPRVADPALTAATDLTAALRAAGITVTGGSATATGGQPAGDSVLAALPGPTVATLVARMLTYSDNDLAESLGRLVSLHDGGAGTFAGAAAAVRGADAGFGMDSSTLTDTSGLSTLDRVAPASLVAILRAAVGPGRPDLRPLALGLAVAGRTGTLAGRYKGGPGLAGAGRVHAKTGALTGVSTEVGWVLDGRGRMLLFAFGSDAALSRPAAETALDAAAAALVGVT